MLDHQRIGGCFASNLTPLRRSWVESLSIPRHFSEGGNLCGQLPGLKTLASVSAIRATTHRSSSSQLKGILRLELSFGEFEFDAPIAAERLVGDAGIKGLEFAETGGNEILCRDAAVYEMADNGNGACAR